MATERWNRDKGSAASDDAATVTSGLTVRRLGRRGWLRVTGELTAMTTRHLDDLLDWLITDGVTQITVSLATAKDLAEPSLVVLRVAQAELHQRGGQLLVNAARSTARDKLGRLDRLAGSAPDASAATAHRRARRTVGHPASPAWEGPPAR